MQLISLPLPRRVEAQQVAAMGAAVDEGVDRAGGVAHDDDRGLADGGGDLVARLGDLGRQAQIVPGRPLEDPLLLERGTARDRYRARNGTSLMPFDGQRAGRSNSTSCTDICGSSSRRQSFRDYAPDCAWRSRPPLSFAALRARPCGSDRSPSSSTGLVPGIHVFLFVDGRNKSGHDDQRVVDQLGYCSR